MEGMYKPDIYAKESSYGNVWMDDGKEALNAMYGRSMLPCVPFGSDFGKPIGEFFGYPSYESIMNRRFGTRLIPERILKSGSATIVFWKDGTKTVVKCAKDEEPNDYNAFTAALAIKLFGTNSHVKSIIKNKTVIQDKKGKVK